MAVFVFAAINDIPRHGDRLATIYMRLARTYSVFMWSDGLYETVLKPLLFRMDPESAHEAVFAVLERCGWFAGFLPLRYELPDLRVRAFGRQLANPVGLAAGFDKNGLLVEHIGALGFGFAEIGSVCARPHGGNPRPRLFRLPEDRALVNRLGLNGLGAETVCQRLVKMSFSVPVGINIAKTNDPSLTGEAAAQDLACTFSLVQSLPVAYVTVNASCPNTAEGCLRELSMLEQAISLMQAQNEKDLPILVKLSPDSTDSFLEELISCVEALGVRGYVCGNTTVKRSNLLTDSNIVEACGAGGLSGAPLKSANLALTKKVRSMAGTDSIIIGCGGIFTGQDAYDYLRAGASLIELYTGLVYRGPSVVRNICHELSALLKQEGTVLARPAPGNSAGS